eukprot:COSAG02_NODE_952_length_15692_cov_7.587764_9_plen_729_part_00
MSSFKAAIGVAIFTLGSARAELTIIGINAGGSSCLHDGDVMEQDRYFMGGIPHEPESSSSSSSRELEDGNGKDDAQPKQTCLTSTSRVGPVIMYSLPVPANAGDHDRGWDFALSLLFDSEITFGPPFEGDIIVDILVQGVVVEHAVQLSGAGARKDVTIPLRIEPAGMVLALPSADSAVHFGGFIHVQIKPVPLAAEIVHLAGLRLFQPTASIPTVIETKTDSANREVDGLLGWLRKTLLDSPLGWALKTIPGQSITIYVVLLGMQNATVWAYAQWKRHAVLWTSWHAQSTQPEKQPECSAVGVATLQPASSVLQCDKGQPDIAVTVVDSSSKTQDTQSKSKGKRRPRKVLKPEEIQRQRKAEAEALEQALATKLAAARRCASAQISVDGEEKDTTEALARNSLAQMTDKKRDSATTSTRRKRSASQSMRIPVTHARQQPTHHDVKGNEQARSDTKSNADAPMQPQFSIAATATETAMATQTRSTAMAQENASPKATPPSRSSSNERSSVAADCSYSDTNESTSSVVSSVDEPSARSAAPASLENQTGPETWAERVASAIKSANGAQTTHRRKGNVIESERKGEHVEQQERSREHDGLIEEDEVLGEDVVASGDDADEGWTPRADAEEWTPVAAETSKHKRKRRRKRRKKYELGAAALGADIQEWAAVPQMCYFGAECLRPDCPYLHVVAPVMHAYAVGHEGAPRETNAGLYISPSGMLVVPPPPETE